jgi:hypothetical protein
MITSKGEAEAVARTAAQVARERDREHARLWSEGRGVLQVTLGAWACLVGVVSYRWIGPRLYVIWHYGWARVRDEGITIVRWESLRDTLVVSNGDRLRVWEMERDLFMLPGLVVIMAVTAPLIWAVWRLLWPRTAD